MKFFAFEIRYWLRQPMVYIFFIINTLMIFGATYSENITVGGSFGNIVKNAPYVIANYYAIMSIITLLMTTSFVLASTTRDFTYNTFQILFTTPVNRVQYLVGRFLGATFISLLPMLGVSAGVIIGCLMPDMDAEKVGPILFNAHLHSFLLLAVPNTLFSASVVFMIAALTRNTIAAFGGALALLLATGIAGSFAEDLNTEWLSILLDPYGASTFSILTKYWTVSQKNTELLSIEGLMLYNRLLWLGVSLALILITVKLFSFTEKSKKGIAKAEPTVSNIPKLLKPLPSVNTRFTSSSWRIMFFERFKFEMKSILKSPTFIILMAAGLMNFIPSLISDSGPFGLSAHPVTHSMIDNIEGSFYAFLIAIIIIYSGSLVWKERESKIDEIIDATPHPTAISYLSKFCSLSVIVLIIQLLCIATSISVQLAKGFTDVRPDVYLKTMIGINYTRFLMLIVLSMTMHAFINNKYIAFFAFVVFLLLNNFLWMFLEVDSNMVQFSASPQYKYSDMTGYGPYVPGIVWFRVYWGIFAVLLALISIFAWNRGREFQFSKKLNAIKEGFRHSSLKMVVGLILAWLLTAGFVFYNTQVLNPYKTKDQETAASVDYEKQYKKYERLVQPRVTDVVYHIDLYPEDRRVKIDGVLTLKNKSHISIDSLHFTTVRFFTTSLNVKKAKRVYNDEKLNYSIYQLDSPLMPGDSLVINYTAEYDAKGFENEVSFNSIVDNGSFFNNFDFSPQVGYQPSYELQDRDKRKKEGLPELPRMPKLQRNCSAACMNSYLGNNSDWVNVETYFSTSGDETAVAPGTLLKAWKKDGRNHYHYRLDHASMNFYSFISARYEVLRSNHKGIDVEVYYDQKHKYNIDKMEKSMKKSLDYYTTNFGPYYHKQVRIIEFPAYASFAQAFPGSMPYSESIGFIAKIEEEDDIDMVFYVVAHEMAHQYWAHQVIGAEMQGATMLSETFAQYSALMVMEKEYGRDAMKKFLKYEMDEYLRSRGTERLKELPLMQVENQGYIHYRKGSLVMYYLKEMIGEAAVNKSLQALLETYKYKEPPYPTSHHAVDLFKANTPDSLQYIITDLFETITLFSNRAVKAEARLLSDSTYEVTIDVTSKKFRADSLGRETPVAVADWIEIGVLGKPEDGKKSGRMLYRKKHYIRNEKSSFVVTVKGKPYEAGIDPVNLLVDVVGEDNLVKISEPESH